MVVLRVVTQVLVKASKPINSEGLYVSEVPKDVSAVLIPVAKYRVTLLKF